MKKIPEFLFYAIVPVIIFAYFGYFISNGNLELLNPHGIIALDQSKILIEELTLAGIIGVIVVGLTFFMAFHFRKENKREHRGSWHASKKLMLLWWAIPITIIAFLGVMNWKTAHALDPYKPINSDQKPITVQLVSLRWKWLFIYPEERIATVNYLEIPVNTPVNFELTSDAPMNSFWIPELGGQIYSMAGMVTQLHLMASDTGVYAGGGAEMSGEGFSGMGFNVFAVSRSDYDKWVSQTQKSKLKLDMATYNQLREPSSYVPPTFYYYADQNLYNEIVMKFMQPKVDMKVMQK